MPNIGQKTTYYPLGYGYCQCGCKRSTRVQTNGYHARYISGHEHLRQLRNESAQYAVDNSSGQSLPSRAKYIDQTKGLVDLVAELTDKEQRLRSDVQVIRAEIELALKLIRDFWKENNNTGRVVVTEKLQGILNRLETKM
jgi:hypothetical protein